ISRISLINASYASMIQPPSFDSLNTQELRPLPPRLATSFRKIRPIVFPIPGNPCKQTAMRRHAFVRAQHDTTSIHDTDFPDRFLRPDRAGARIVEVKTLSR